MLFFFSKLLIPPFLQIIPFITFYVNCKYLCLTKIQITSNSLQDKCYLIENRRVILPVCLCEQILLGFWPTVEVQRQTQLFHHPSLLDCNCCCWQISLGGNRIQESIPVYKWKTMPCYKFCQTYFVTLTNNY